MYIPLNRRDILAGMLYLPQLLLSPPPEDFSSDLWHQVAYSSEGTSLKELQATSFQRIRDAIGDSTQVVLLGEATHGTQEFYQIRLQLTKALIQQDAFDAVLCEGDIESFWKVNEFVSGHVLEKNDDTTNVLDVFQERFPVWMWRNNVIEDFCLWLRDSNMSTGSNVQLLGLDIFGMFQSIDQVVNYLTQAGESVMEGSAKKWYSTLNTYRHDPKKYSEAFENGIVQSQAENVKAVVKSLTQHKQQLMQITGPKEFFHAYENARAVMAAEAYFRQAKDEVASWNLRDSSFAHTIQDTMSFISQSSVKKRPRIIVWAHNSHVGDARATQYAQRGIYNVCQQCREWFGEDHVYSVGFTTHDGTVRASQEWGAHDRIMKLNPSFESSHEYLLHLIAKRRRQNVFGYIFRSNGSDGFVDEAARQVFGVDRLGRFVGLSYDSRETELRSHYSTCRPSEQYDCLLHVDRSTALCVDKFDQ